MGGGVVIVQHEGGAYLMSVDGSLLDPISRQIVGVYNQETQTVDFHEDSINISEPTAPGKATEGEIDVMKHIQKGKELFEKRRFNTAAYEFERAVEGCERQRAVDLDLECEALRGRAKC